MCALGLHASPRCRGRKKGLFVSRKGRVGWRTKLFLRSPGEGLRPARLSPVGAGRGRGREGPGRAQRAPLARPQRLGSSMATRAAAPPRSRPTFKSKWLEPQALGGTREPLPPGSARGVQSPRKAGRSSGRWESRKGLRPRKGNWGCPSWGTVQAAWEGLGVEIMPTTGSSWRPENHLSLRSQPGHPPRRGGWRKGEPRVGLEEGRGGPGCFWGRRGDRCGVGRPSPAPRGAAEGRGAGGQREQAGPPVPGPRRARPGEVAARLPEKVSMAFMAQCSSGQSTKA